MTEQQIDRDTLRRKAKDRYTIFIRPDDLLALLDQLDQAEARIAEEKRLRMKATAAATEAEARFQAVEDVLAAWHVEPGESGLADDLLRALNT